MNVRIAILAALAMVTAISLFISMHAMAQANFEDGLVVYYPFEGDGDIITDKSVEGNHGELHTAKREAEGKFGKALRFDAVMEGAETPNSASYLISNKDEGFTCSYWVFPEALDRAGENRAVFRRRQFNLDLLKGNGRLEVQVAGGWAQSGEGPMLEQHAWHFVAGTWSPKDGSKLYRNGLLVNENPGAIGNIGEQGDALYLGGIPKFQLKGFLGRLDEVRIYKRVLGEDEVLELFEFDPRTRPVTSKGSLAMMWAVLKIGA